MTDEEAEKLLREGLKTWLTVTNGGENVRTDAPPSDDAQIDPKLIAVALNALRTASAVPVEESAWIASRAVWYGPIEYEKAPVKPRRGPRKKLKNQYELMNARRAELLRRKKKAPIARGGMENRAEINLLAIRFLGRVPTRQFATKVWNAFRKKHPRSRIDIDTIRRHLQDLRYLPSRQKRTALIRLS